MYFINYLNRIESEEQKNSIEKTSLDVLSKFIELFDYQSHLNGLLLGNVQSGKTSHVLGVISKLIDEGFRIFILITTDNVYLYKQTLERLVDKLSLCDVFSETDDVNFINNRLNKPFILVLKKNSNVLKKWRNNLSSSGYCSGNPIVIVDDEADAASLNTFVNSNRVSTINKHLSSIKKLSSSSLYLQITATPQSLLLQSVLSKWRPAFICYFEPGKMYLGGDFFYSDPKSFSIRFTLDDELECVKQEDLFIPEGLKDSLMTFLVICGHFYENGDNTCNFLIHPSVRVSDHELFALKLSEHLNLIIASYEENEFVEDLFSAWSDLQKTKPDITYFDRVLLNVVEIIESLNLKIIIVNSKSSFDFDYNTGFNIVIGGNSLGRGITLPKLQTIYYCRKSKKPQADTFWQHCRMFGYDRDPLLMRIFIPKLLHQLFVDINKSNNILINRIINYGINNIQIVLPKNIKPTRSNVLDRNFLNIISGGVNYFPSSPSEKHTTVLDSLLFAFDVNKKYCNITYDELLDIFNYLESVEDGDWDKLRFISCIYSLSIKHPNVICRIIIRNNRNISKGTGTLLSETDRLLGDSFNKDIVLTMYRVSGDEKLGWNGNPLWIPNIKFPDDMVFYDILS
jgi:hypothetical protein